jgi:arylformamidase
MQESPPREMGPLVWLDMDQQALDDAYNQAKYACNREQVLRRYALNSERARAILGEPERVAYGPSEIERLTIFRAPRPHAPINLFVCGGGWRNNTAANYAFLVEVFVGAGAHGVLADYTNVDQAGGDLTPLAEQVRRAIGWVYRHAERFGGDPERLYLSAHSAGAHLAGCALTADWQVDGLPPDLVKGAALMSGMYDLKAVRLSSRSEYVAFTDRIEEALSPARHLDRFATPLILSYGTEETPEFQRQTREFFEAVSAAGKPATLLVADGYNHFEVLETLASPYGLLGRAVLEQMRL